MDKIGIFLTDASFDRRMKVSSISFIEKITNKKNNLQVNNLPNVFEAEFLGIKECLKYGFKKFKNIVIVCDNKAAIFKARKDLIKDMKLLQRFETVQFLWLPREFLNEADFLTKNINNVEQNLKLKKENLFNGNVLDIFISEEDKKEVLNQLINNILNIKNFNIKNIKNNEFKKLLNKNFDFNLNEDFNLLKDDILYIIAIEPKEVKEDSSLSKLINFLSSDR